MPRLLQTIQEYIATKRKKETLYIVFNRGYNNTNLPEELRDENSEDLDMADKSLTDEKEREAFKDYMKNHFPETKLVEVFDIVPLGYLVYPYLGSIAIDTDIGGTCQKALEKRYEDDKGNLLSKNAVLWTLTYDIAKKHHEKQKELLEDEFGEDAL